MPLEPPTLILVMPPQQGLLNGFATGLTSIADFIHSQLPTVKVFLYDFSEERIPSLKAAILRCGAPITDKTIVGVTTTTASYQAALSVAEAFKDVAHHAGLDVTTIFGGHHAGADAEIVLQI